jgi:hypothetical protein
MATDAGERIQSMNRIGPFALAVIGALLLVICPAASAKKKRAPGRIFAVETTGRQVGGQPITLEPQCPSGMKAIGGGFSALSTATFDPSTGVRRVVDVTVPYESRRGSPTSWRVSAIRVHNPQGGTVPLPPGTSDLRATSYCRKFRGGILEATAIRPVVTSPTATSTATASCPRGRFPISGGFSASPAAGPGFTYPSIFESFPVGRRGWQTSANPYTQAAVGVTSFVYCARGAKPPLRRTGTKSVPGTIGTRACPKRLQVHGGGFKLNPNEGSLIGFSVASAARTVRNQQPGVPYLVGQTWNVGGGNFLGTSSIPIAYGFCS